MTNVGEVTKKKAGAATLNVGLVVLIVGGILAMLNAANEGSPPGWTLVLIGIGAVSTIGGYAHRILVSVESR